MSKKYPKVKCPKCGVEHRHNHMYNLCEKHMLDLIWGEEE